MSRLVKNTVIYALGDILPKIFSFFTFPVLTSYLTPAEYGIVNYVNTMNIFLIVFCVLCLNTYYLVYYYRQDDEEQRKKLLGNLTIFILGVTLLVSAIIFIVGFTLEGNHQNGIDFYPYIVIGIAINIFNVFSVLPLATYRLEETPLPVASVNVLRGGLTMALTLVLVIEFEYKALGVLLSTLLINALFAIYFIIITLRKSILCFDWGQIKKALIFSLPLVPGSLSYYLVSMSDRILIESNIGLTELGIYSTASTLALLLNIISMGAYKAFEPYFFRIYGSDSFLSKFQKVHDSYFVVLLLGALALALFSKDFLALMSSEEFHSAYLYIPLLLVGVLASSMSLLYGTILTAQEKTKISSMISIIGGGCSVILNIVLLPLLGIWAACLTSAVTFAGMMLMSLMFSRIKVSYRCAVMSLLLTFALSVFPIYVLNVENVLLSLMIKVILFVLISLACCKIMNLKLKYIYGIVFN